MSRVGKRRPLPRSRGRKKWYVKKDYEVIARAIGDDFLVHRVVHWAHLFEHAADWYFLARDGPDRGTPSITRKKLKQIASSANKLLKHLGVENASNAADGPVDWVLADALASAIPHGTEDDVAHAAGRIGRLIEITHAIEAARDLAKMASQAAVDQTDLARISGVGGHLGDTTENNWIACMMETYQAIVEKKPDPGRGGTGNPLTRFLKAAGAPLGIKLSRDWRSRIRIARAKPRPGYPDRDQYFTRRN